jgi:branched-chain amino acid aminotransferase
VLLALLYPYAKYDHLLKIPKRLRLQTFDGAAFLELIKELVRIDKNWIPTQPGYSLYIRPTMSA